MSIFILNFFLKKKKLYINIIKIQLNNNKYIFNKKLFINVIIIKLLFSFIPKSSVVLHELEKILSFWYKCSLNNFLVFDDIDDIDEFLFESWLDTSSAKTLSYKIPSIFLDSFLFLIILLFDTLSFIEYSSLMSPEIKPLRVSDLFLKSKVL